MTEAMIQQARMNAAKLDYENVDFVLGDIEEMPLEDGIADVVVSNCVLNLVPDKEKAFAETLRILKSGGHFSISDVVIAGDQIGRASCRERVSVWGLVDPWKGGTRATPVARQ